LALYAVRAPMIRSRAGYAGLSREVVLLINNLLLVVALAVVLLGTLYPLAYEAVTGGDKISVGPPYFNSMFVPLMAILALALGLAPVARWKRTRARLYVDRLGWVFLASAVLGVVLPLLLSGELRLSVTLAVALALWIVISHLADVWRRAGSIRGLFRLPVAYAGMLLAHLGFAVCLLGVSVTSQLSVERDQRVEPGTELALGPLQLTFVGVSQSRGPNYTADVGHIRVVGDGEPYELRPERRRYQSGGNIMTEAAIAGGAFKDVFVALGEPLGGGAWALRAQYKPLVRWVWFGALLMGLGGACAVLDPRYRRLRERHATRSDAVDAPA
jgi:cytochrome c-type biogenesis protein CcmF